MLHMITLDELIDYKDLPTERYENRYNEFFQDLARAPIDAAVEEINWFDSEAQVLIFLQLLSIEYLKPSFEHVLSIFCNIEGFDPSNLRQNVRLTINNALVRCL